MTKFVVVKEEPKELHDGSIVIDSPNFLDEIRQCQRKKPISKLITPNYLREIIARVGDKYADDDFNALTAVNVSAYRGIPCEDDMVTHEVLCKALQSSYPEMFDKYIEYHIKRRPHGTKLIYFVGDFIYSSKFTEYGIEQIKEKDVPVYLGFKKKKIIGKPAITNKQSHPKNSRIKFTGTTSVVIKSYLEISLKNFNINSVERKGIVVYWTNNIEITRRFQDKVDWDIVSTYPSLSEDFIREFQDKVNWAFISWYQELSEDFIREFQDKVSWYRISWRQKLSEDFIRKFRYKVGWHYISQHQELSKDFVREHRYFLITVGARFEQRTEICIGQAT